MCKWCWKGDLVVKKLLQAHQFLSKHSGQLPAFLHMSSLCSGKGVYLLVFVFPLRALFFFLPNKTKDTVLSFI